MIWSVSQDSLRVQTFRALYGSSVRSRSHNQYFKIVKIARTSTSVAEFGR